MIKPTEAQLAKTYTKRDMGDWESQPAVIVKCTCAGKNKEHNGPHAGKTGRVVQRWNGRTYVNEISWSGKKSRASKCPNVTEWQLIPHDQMDARKPRPMQLVRIKHTVDQSDAKYEGRLGYSIYIRWWSTQAGYYLRVVPVAEDGEEQREDYIQCYDYEVADTADVIEENAEMKKQVFAMKKQVEEAKKIVQAAESVRLAATMKVYVAMKKQTEAERERDAMSGLVEKLREQPYYMLQFYPDFVTTNTRSINGRTERAAFLQITDWVPGK